MSNLNTNPIHEKATCIGRSSGNCSTPHLHFELTVNDELIDSYKEIKAVNG